MLEGYFPSRWAEVRVGLGGTPASLIVVVDDDCRLILLFQEGRGGGWKL